MKIAVCYTGLVRTDFQRNLASVKHHFPKADYFFSTWESRELPVDPSIEHVQVVPEPKPHYHPFLDSVIENPHPKFAAYKGKGRNGRGHATYERTLHQCKQILGHAHLLNRIPADYDLIIRMRYDTFLSKRVKFDPWLQQSYDEQCAIGFGTRSTKHRNLHVFTELKREYPVQGVDKSYDWAWLLLDVMIIHPPKLFDSQLAFSLYEQKKLWSSEFGWYQILSQPHSSNHHCVYGGAQTNAFLREHPGYDK